MPSTYSDNFKLQLMATGENAGSWGDVTNVNLGTALEEALGGTIDVTFASATVTLTAEDENTTQLYRHMRLNLGGTSGGAQDLIVPAVQKLYIVDNGCADAITVKVTGQTGIAVPAGKTMFIYNDGTDCVDAVTHLSSLTLDSPLAVAQGGTGSATATFSGANITSLNASNISAGTLDNARTTAASANGASTIVARDASGDFAANAITGVSFSGSGASLTSLNASNISAGTLANARTNASSANGASTLVTRDGSGDFAGNEITAVTFSGTNSTTGNISLSTNTIATIDTDEDLVLDPNGSGVVDVNNSKISNVTDPTADQDAATKVYVDSLVASGVHYHTPVRLENPGNLTATYDNGTAGVGATLTNSGAQAALSLDGVAVSVSDRVLIYEQTDATQNGIYTVTDIGSESTNWVLTRATDADSYGIVGSDILGEGSAVFVQEGNTGAGETYVCNTTGTITFGTTDITFVQVSAAPVYTADTDTGIQLALNEFSLTTVPIANGGTGSSTAAFSGANITSLNATAISSGTIANARTTASSSNGASTIIARDASGNFTTNVVNATTVNAGQVGLDSTDYMSFTNNTRIDFYVNNSNEFRMESDGDFHADGDLIAYSTTISDERLKTNIVGIENAVAKVSQLNGYTFEYKSDGKVSAGVIAQEIEAVLPEAVTEKLLPLKTDDGQEYKVVNYDALHGLLIEAVKELAARVAKLEDK